VLKITLMETPTENRWILQGQLVGPWVQELRTLWKKKRRAHTGQKCVLDLNDVTFIDKSGETLLRAICKKGAQLVASGVYTKHLVEKVKTKQRLDLRNLPVVLFAALLIIPAMSSNCPRIALSSGTTVQSNANRDSVKSMTNQEERSCGSTIYTQTAQTSSQTVR
jgi:ABC-type transporter Mla MlaB component